MGFSFVTILRFHKLTFEKEHGMDYSNASATGFFDPFRLGKVLQKGVINNFQAKNGL